MTTAQPIEVKKDGLRQMQDGTWKLSLTVHPNDMPTSLMTAPMGTRYGMALVEIGDDEQPIPSHPEPQQAKTSQRKERTRSQMAAIRCGDYEWRHWSGCPDTWDNGQVAQWLRQHLDIQSRKELDTNTEKAAVWDAMDEQFKMATGRSAERIGG